MDQEHSNKEKKFKITTVRDIVSKTEVKKGIISVLTKMPFGQLGEETKKMSLMPMKVFLWVCIQNSPCRSIMK